jgi:hypothetical protein
VDNFVNDTMTIVDVDFPKGKRKQSAAGREPTVLHSPVAGREPTVVVQRR